MRTKLAQAIVFHAKTLSPSLSRSVSLAQRGLKLRALRCSLCFWGAKSAPSPTAADAALLSLVALSLSAPVMLGGAWPTANGVADFCKEPDRQSRVRVRCHLTVRPINYSYLFRSGSADTSRDRVSYRETATIIV